MTTQERREAIKEYKAERGCYVCGRRPDPRRLLLVRPDGSGLSFSRLVNMRSVSDEDLWEEASRRVVVCQQCSAWAAQHIGASPRVGVSS
jgi:hypothetical protein